MIVWMHDKEIAVIEKYLKPTDFMFEWGAGGSTLHFAKQVNKYVSVEHDKDWYNLVLRYVRNLGLMSKVMLFHVEPNAPRTIPTKYEQFHDYINFIPDTYSEIKFDKVFIDGRARQFCAMSALKFIKPNGLMFIHDYFERERYFSIEQRWELVDAVRDTPQTLAVFRPRGAKL